MVAIISEAVEIVQGRARWTGQKPEGSEAETGEERKKSKQNRKRMLGRENSMSEAEMAGQREQSS